MVLHLEVWFVMEGHQDRPPELLREGEAGQVCGGGAFPYTASEAWVGLTPVLQFRHMLGLYELL